MSTTFEGYRLQRSFTFHIMEMIKETRIRATSHKTTLPWGLSIAAGLVAIFISFTIPFSPFFPIGMLIGSVLPTQTQIAEFGEVLVDTIEITGIPVISTEKGADDFGQKPRPNSMSAFAPERQEGKWRGRTRMRTKRWMLAATVVNGKIYAIGGWAGRAKGTRSTVEEYDPVTDTWTQKADMPTRRSALSTSVVNGKIYAIGGYNLVEDFLTVEMYDPATDMWVKKADMPTPRSNFATGVVNGGIHAIGGTAMLGSGELGRWETISKVEVYQPARDRWTKEVDMRVPRGYIAASTVNGKIYVIGGTSVRPSLPLAKVEEFDTGFAVNPAGKLATSWGQIKSVH